jgi:hypothetical protein
MKQAEGMGVSSKLILCFLRHLDEEAALPHGAAPKSGWM